MRFLILLILVSCSQSKKYQIENQKKNYSYTDETGKYYVKELHGIKGKNHAYVKRVLSAIEEPDKALEKSTSMSELGMIKTKKGKGHPILRPMASYYEVWFSKKKYSSEIRIDKKNKEIAVKMQSPVTKWNGIKRVKFPTTRGIFCFYQQLISCINATGFTDEAIKNSKGSVPVYIIWDGYPFLQEQYAGVPDEVVTKALISYDKNYKGLHGLKLEFSGQTLFYRLNNDLELEQFFWISQAITKMAEK